MHTCKMNGIIYIYTVQDFRNMQDMSETWNSDDQGNYGDIHSGRLVSALNIP